MTFVAGEVRVSVPATSANLGPGYDSLGLALGIRNQASAVLAEKASVEVRGEGAGEVPTDATNLVYASMLRGFAAMGVEPPTVALTCVNNIPHGRGLGSSSSAIVAGLGLARALLPGREWSLEELFRVAADIEGHPDNVAPAVFGGLTISYAEGGSWRTAQAPVDPRVEAVVLVPGTVLETKVARGLIPATVPHADAAADAGRTALLVAALGGRPDLLLDATRDYLHQDYREPAMPETLALVRALREAGHAAVVSGAGPTVLVLGTAGGAAGVRAAAPPGWAALAPSVEPRGLVSA